MSATARPLPLYERVKHHLLARIAAGDWRDGARLPSEHELMDQFGASRMTVHRALREMSAAGVLRRVQGRGTFIQREQPRLALLEITDIADDILRRGHRHQARVIKLEAIRADAALAAAFGVKRGAKLFHSEIVHCEDGVPVQLEQRDICPTFAPGYLAQDFSAATTYRYLQNIAPAAEVEHIVHAVLPDLPTQALLEIGPAEPCLRLTRRTWTAAGPATRSILTHPGSRYAFASRNTLP
jgi:GntR family histidine utilization transcriptional repressor